MPPRIGVLALQGDFSEHLLALEALGSSSFAVRSREQIESADGLIIPGGESTTILKLLDRFDLRDLLIKRIEAGMPVFGTCAGAIVLSSSTSDGEEPLGVLPVSILRNAYGRQVDSFETVLEAKGIGPIPAVFIRAPIIEEVADGLEVLATFGERPVLIRKDSMLASTFHTEITGDLALHSCFTEMVNPS